MNVKESPWAESTRQHWSDLAQAIPALEETEFVLWQRRVDNPRFAHPWPNHAYLYCVNCLRYVLRVDGAMNTWTPTSPPQELNFLVVADHIPGTWPQRSTPCSKPTVMNPPNG